VRAVRRLKSTWPRRKGNSQTTSAAPAATMTAVAATTTAAVAEAPAVVVVAATATAVAAMTTAAAATTIAVAATTTAAAATMIAAEATTTVAEAEAAVEVETIAGADTTTAVAATTTAAVVLAPATRAVSARCTTTTVFAPETVILPLRHSGQEVAPAAPHRDESVPLETAGCRRLGAKRIGTGRTRWTHQQSGQFLRRSSRQMSTGGSTPAGNVTHLTRWPSVRCCGRWRGCCNVANLP
jgi:hypothetical protein